MFPFAVVRGRRGRRRTRRRASPPTRTSARCSCAPTRRCRSCRRCRRRAVTGLASDDMVVRDRRRDADRLRRPRAHARRRVPAPRPDRGGARRHDRPARQLRHRGVEDLHDDADRRALLLRRPRPGPPADRPARSSTTCARSGRRSSARTRASRRSSARRPSSPTRATSARPPRATPTSRSSSTTRASSPNTGGTGPYDPNDPRPQGVDRLIRSLQDAGVEPNAQRVRRARRHLVVRHARPDRRRARARQAAEVRRRGPRRVGHRLDLVRHAAGPDPGDAHVPDLARSSRSGTATRRSPTS